MNIEQQDGEVRITFRPAGWGRFFLVAFLTFWLGGWAAGEAVALWFLWTGLRRGAEIITHPMGWLVGGFLLAWLAGWTVGGIAAFVEVLRLLFGVDRLTVTPSSFRLFRGAGPIGRVRVFDRSAVRDLYVRQRSGPLTIDTTEGRFPVTAFGTAEDRRLVAERYGPRINSGLPARWISWEDAEGTTHIRDRKFDSPGCLALVLLFALTSAAFTILFSRSIPFGWALLSGAVAAASAGLFLWGLMSRREWLVGRDSIAGRVSCMSWSRVTRYEPGSLSVERSVDSDGDEAVSLVGTSGGRRKVIFSDSNEDRDVVGLARFIEERSGWPAGLPSELRRQ